MTDYKKVFIDTAPFIYYLEQHPQYFEKAMKIFDYCIKQGMELVTSVITVEEYAVYPYMNNQSEYIDNFEAFINDIGILVVEIDKVIAKKAALLRSEYRGFKGMDALQLGAAIETKCDVFLTNDKQLRQVSQIKSVTLEEFLGEIY